MAHYGDSGGGGGGDAVVNLPTVESSLGGGLTIFDSQYQFTDPPRFYKANDPYYFEVDNIPIKQLHENCLWLRDQILGATFEVSGIKKQHISDLRPYVTESDRMLRVQPGNFIGRVNSMPETIESAGPGGIADITARLVQGSPVHNTIKIDRFPIYEPYGTIVNNSAFRTILGVTTGNLLQGVGSNGLFDHYQIHPIRKVSEDEVSISWRVAGEEPTGMLFPGPSDLPYTVEHLTKVQTAAWRQAMLSQYSSPRQLATDFCRKWGGVFRTSVVNVPETLSVEIALFDEHDYMDNSEGYTPQVRIDLVYVYTKAIDSMGSVPIAKRDGSNPARITTPVLGVVQGAGGILTANAGAIDITTEIATNPDIFNSAEWAGQSTINHISRYYDTPGGVEGDVDLAILSPLADQVVGSYAFDSAPTYSFPSPDDLLNLAPAIVDTLSEQALESVGQSVLPLCYVIVKNGQFSITSEDIIDIRPFLRTTELAYNERAGVAAANPPLSLANPAVGKSELYDIVQLARDYVLSTIDQAIADGIEANGLVGVAPSPKIVRSTYVGPAPNALYKQGINGDPNNPVGILFEGESEAHTWYNNNDISIYPTANFGVNECFSGNGGKMLIPGRYFIDATATCQPATTNTSHNYTRFALQVLGMGAGATLYSRIWPTWPPGSQTGENNASEVDSGFLGWDLHGGQGTMRLVTIVNILELTEVRFVLSAVDGLFDEEGSTEGNLSYTIDRISNLDGTNTNIH